MSVDPRGWLALACTLALAACGGPGKATGTDAAPMVAATATAPAPPAAGGFAVLPALPSTETEGLGIHEPLKLVHYRDTAGEGLLVLARTDSRRHDADSDENMEVATLTATLYGRATPGAPFVQRWQSENPTECAGLDLDAGYFLDQVGASDLDGDGVAELTLASHSFCGGGVDPQQIVIELRRDNDIYRIDGESLVTIEGDAPFGGERQDSASYKEAPPLFQKHMDAVWKAVYARRGGQDEATP
ncbi:hypothetical protein KQ945_04260 [Bacillus subtilis subsp. subtilis]|nr:hypothetical protein [Bacillus subtilis subsp. subtilis]